MIKIIINADDLGLNPEVNKTIDDAMSKKFITSATILANSLYLDVVKDIISKHPNCSFGVHLNLSEGKSLTSSIILQKYNIIDNNGYFTHNFNALNTKINLDLEIAIHNEWKAQITFLINSGIKIDHIDSHHHVHMNFNLYPILISLAKDFSITKIRTQYRQPYIWTIEQFLHRFLNNILPKNVNKNASIITKTTDNNTIKKSSTKNKYVIFVKNYIHIIQWIIKNRINGIENTDYFDSYEHLCKMLERGMILKNNSTIELMCHPGHKKYVNEYLLIQQKEIEVFIKDFTYISYKELDIR